MVHAVRVPDRNSIYFIMGEPVTKPGWVVEPGAWLEVPLNTFYSFREADRPMPAICRSLEDPLHYKVYMDPYQAEPDEWEVTDLNFGGTFSEAKWRRHAEFLDRRLPVPSNVSDEQVAAYERAMSNLLGGR